VFSRILGKTQLGQLTFYEYISGITIGSIAGSIIASEPEKVWIHYYDLVLFFGLTYLTATITIKSRPLRKMIEGSPTIVIENGRILEDNMRGMRYDLDELMGQLREKGIFDLSEVQYAIIETTGNISIFKKADNQPVTRSDLNIHKSEAQIPLELVMDGEVIEENLNKAGVTRQWVKDELLKRGINSLDDTVYAVIDSKGKLAVSVDSKKKGWK